MPPRPRVEPTDDWHQIALLARAPRQRSYELIRPVVLFGQSPAERAVETGASIRTVYRQVARFDQLGLAGLVPPTVEKHRTLPPEIRQAISSPRSPVNSPTLPCVTDSWPERPSATLPFVHPRLRKPYGASSAG